MSWSQWVNLTPTFMVYTSFMLHDEMSSTPLSPLPVFVDTDIGDDIDDALALALLLCSPEVSVVGVSTVFGDTYLRARLAAYLLQIYGCPEVPVAAGQELPLLLRHRPSGVCQTSVLPEHLALPLSPLSGAELLIQAAYKYPGQLTLLCLGPLTNVALALQQEPHLISLLRQVFFMGGASRISRPDWNVRSDAQAAHVLLEARLPLTMIGLDVTASCHLQRGDVARIHNTNNPRLHLLSCMVTAWQEHQPWWRSRLPYLHDPLVVTALCAPQLFRFAPLPVRVLTRGPLVGWTLPRWPNGPIVRAALSVEHTQARTWILQRLFATEAA
jgi:inosine-uridine nucleoside N-ribohydrolase